MNNIFFIELVRWLKIILAYYLISIPVIFILKRKNIMNSDRRITVDYNKDDVLCYRTQFLLIYNIWISYGEYYKTIREAEKALIDEGFTNRKK